MKNKNKFIKISILFVLFLTSFLPVMTFSQNTQQAKTVNDYDFSGSGYKLISPIGSTTEVKDVTKDGQGFSNFINYIITISIAFAGATAVVFIIIRGIQYIGTDSVWTKNESKLGIAGAFGGLALLLLSYTILNIINPELVNIRIGGLDRISTKGSIATTLGGGGGKTQDKTLIGNKKNGVTDSCYIDKDKPDTKVGSCESLKSEFTIKPGNGEYVSKQTAVRLKALKIELDKNEKIKGNIRVTEAMPESRSHKNQCHKNGTCIDLGFTNASLYKDADAIKYLMQKGDENNLCVVFEDKPGSKDLEYLQNNGVRTQAWEDISAIHFSIYAYNCKQ